MIAISGIQVVAIRRLSKVVATPKGGVELPFVAALGANLLGLGYSLNNDALKALQEADKQLLSEILEAAKSIKGVADYKPMYRNFPKQVIKASDAELYVNAVMHYLGDHVGVRIMPHYKNTIRKPLKEMVEVTSLGVATDGDLGALAEMIMVQGQPFSPQDKEDLEVLRPFVSRAIETGIKENFASLAAMFPEYDWQASCKTVTDVLRLATAYSGGDVSLATNSLFRLSRAERRLVLKALDAVLTANGGTLEDFTRHLEKWKRLATTLHYHETGSSPVIKALQTVQMGQAQSFNSILEHALETFNLMEVMNLVALRPGIFARRLAEILRKFPSERSFIIREFEAIAPSVSLPVLVQMWGLFAGPTRDQLPHRFIMSKSGSTLKMVDNQRQNEDCDVVKAIESGVRGRHGDVRIYLDPRHYQYAIPLAIRHASKGGRQIGRGSHVEIPNRKGTIRLFIHWHNINTGDYRRVDIDLSAVFASQDFERTETVAYYHLRSDCAWHSGDITSAPDGAAEFIDIDIKTAITNGWRYVMPVVHSYTRQPLNSVPEAWAGVMYREKPKSGEIFEPATVAERFDLTIPGPSSTPFAFDLIEGSMIWLDVAMQPNSRKLFNVASNQVEINEAFDALVKQRPMTLVRFIGLVATVAATPDDADLVLDPTSSAQMLALLVD